MSHDDKQVDAHSGVATTGHEWDGIQELNNPLPRWWLWTFYLTIAWSLVYTVAYPAWPLVSSATSGLLGYSSRLEVRDELAAAQESRSAYVEAVRANDLNAILADDALRQFAVSAGAAAFRVNCIQCHGSGAQGSPGYPNLNDDDWLWGGDIEAIYQTIGHGIRFAGDEETRYSEMPAFADMLRPEEIRQVAAYVVSLTADPSSPALAEAGQRVFADNCAACHGDDARGNLELGAPNLADAIWHYGSSEGEIARQIRAPKHGVMPAWQGRLGDVAVKELAIFVHSLGGGQ